MYGSMYLQHVLASLLNMFEVLFLVIISKIACSYFADNCLQVTLAATNGADAEYTVVEEEPQKND